MIYPNKKTTTVKTRVVGVLEKSYKAMTRRYSGCPCYISNAPRRFFSGIQRCSCTITSDNDAYCCIGFVWGFLRPVNPIPIGFDVNYIIVAQKNQKEYIPGYFWLAFEFCFLYNMRRNHAERWQSGNAADC